MLWSILRILTIQIASNCDRTKSEYHRIIVNISTDLSYQRHWVCCEYIYGLFFVCSSVLGGSVGISCSEQQKTVKIQFYQLSRQKKKPSIYKAKNTFISPNKNWRRNSPAKWCLCSVLEMRYYCLHSQTKIMNTNKK